MLRWQRYKEILKNGAIMLLNTQKAGGSTLFYANMVTDTAISVMDNNAIFILRLI